MTQPLPADPIFAAIEAHRDAHLARAAVRYLPIHRETKKAPDVPRRPSSVRLACRQGRMSIDRKRPRPKIVPRRQVAGP